MTYLTQRREGIFTFVLELSPNALRPHSKGGLSARHSAKGQTGNLSMTHDPMTSDSSGQCCFRVHGGHLLFKDTHLIIPRRAAVLSDQGQKRKTFSNSKIIFFFLQTLGGANCWDVLLTNIWDLTGCTEAECTFWLEMMKQEPEGAVLWGYTNKTLDTKGITGACNWHHVLLFSKHRWPCSA